MRLATVRTAGGELAAVVLDRGIVTLDTINQATGRDFPTEMAAFIGAGRLDELRQVLQEAGRELPVEPAETVVFAPPYRRPGKIWGIGLNYRAHAADLDENVPEEPASFMKPATAIIGPGDAVVLPAASRKVTAEAELAVIIGRHCRNISREEAAGCIFGYTCVIDMTAEDILRRNPRFLTRAKSFDTFFSFGPVILTADEVPDVFALRVRTVVNGEVRAENTVANMTFDPFALVAFHSEVMTLEPGDIISTGTPGAWPIARGDTVRCEIDGFPPLENPVVGGSLA